MPEFSRLNEIVLMDRSNQKKSLLTVPNKQNPFAYFNIKQTISYGKDKKEIYKN